MVVTRSVLGMRQLHGLVGHDVDGNSRGPVVKAVSG